MEQQKLPYLQITRKSTGAGFDQRFVGLKFKNKL